MTTEGVVVATDRRGAAGLTDRGFEDFFDSVWPRALALATRIGVDRSEAEDVALDGLAITYDRWSRVEGLDYREAWTLRVVANLAVRRLKKQRAVVAALPASIVFEDGVTSRLVVRETLIGLPRRQREVICLRYLADMSEAEVAVALGIDVGSVKQHASRGRRAVRDILIDADQGGDRRD
jgi:RNA polymerase sigma factor (sigma-70 family)